MRPVPDTDVLEDCERLMLEISRLHKGHGLSIIMPSMQCIIELSLITHAASCPLFAYQGGSKLGRENHSEAISL